MPAKTSKATKTEVLAALTEHHNRRRSNGPASIGDIAYGISTARRDASTANPDQPWLKNQHVEQALAELVASGEVTVCAYEDTNTVMRGYGHVRAGRAGTRQFALTSQVKAWAEAEDARLTAVSAAETAVDRLRTVLSGEGISGTVEYNRAGAVELLLGPGHAERLADVLAPGDASTDDRPRNTDAARDELARVEALVWYSRYRPHADDPTYPADAHAHARWVEENLSAAIAAIDFDQQWQVSRLEGQQAALRWVLEPDLYDGLSTSGELYDS